MTLGQLGGLFIVYFFSLLFILTLTYIEFRRVKFNFNVFFSLLYLLTFYFGFPFTCLLVFRFDVAVVPVDSLLYALLASVCFYAIYYVSYKVRLVKPRERQVALLPMNNIETHLTWIFLALFAIGAVTLFFLQNGFLLFKLTSYSQIFGSDVTGIAYKRFFYFFIPAMLVVYFLRPTWRAWIMFLVVTVGYGILTYLIVGGTRANIIIAFALFLFIGIVRGWITLWMLFTAGAFGVLGMFWLALKRYGLDVTGEEAFYTFLYLTRDTFSPWENLALLLNNYDKIEFQGLAPIVRDFYVFIPSWVWPERPDQVINTANYFTWEVLNYHAGLAISPTLIGSLVVMGGIAFIPLGAIFVGLVIKFFDWVYEQGKQAKNRYEGAILQAFCFGAIFNMIVLAREGVDSFVSRVVFFSAVFLLCLVVAKLVYWFLEVGRIVKHKVSHAPFPSVDNLKRQ